MPDSTNQIQLYHAGLARDVLGPGLRLVFWFSGCPLRCPGCIETPHWDTESGNRFSLVDLIANCQQELQQVEGVSFSGGEPLYQAAALETLVKRLPAHIDKLLFTGYRRDELTPQQEKLFAQMDLCIEGRFEQQQAGSFKWRGSANQVITSPTGKYPGKQLAEWMEAPSDGISVHVQEDCMVFYGVPTPDMLSGIRDNLKHSGVEIRAM